MRSAPAITFDYRPSRLVRAAVLGMALLAAAATLASGLAPWLQAAALAFVAAYLVYVVRDLSTPQVQRCAWHADGQWRVRTPGGDEHPAQLLHAAARGPLIVLVLLAGPLRRVALVLLPDNSDPDLRRRLRVRLSRVAATPSADT